MQCNINFLAISVFWCFFNTIERFHTIPGDTTDRRHSDHVGSRNKRKNQNYFVESTSTWLPWCHFKTLYRGTIMFCIINLGFQNVMISLNSRHGITLFAQKPHYSQVQNNGGWLELITRGVGMTWIGNFLQTHR